MNLKNKAHQWLSEIIFAPLSQNKGFYLTDDSHYAPGVSDDKKFFDFYRSTESETLFEIRSMFVAFPNTQTIYLTYVNMKNEKIENNSGMLKDLCSGIKLIFEENFYQLEYCDLQLESKQL